MKPNFSIFILIVLSVVILLEFTTLLNLRKGDFKERDLPLRTAATIKSNAEAREHWQSRIEAVGGKRAYEEFKSIYGKESVLIGHQAAHVFGEALYEKEGLAATKVCDATFGFGCFHTVFLVAIYEHGPEVVNELDQACVTAFGPGGGGCFHGLGHGLLAYYSPSRLVEALEACADLSWKKPLLGCSGGIWMEYFFPTHESGTQAATIKFDPISPHKPCSEISEKFRPSCFYEIGRWWHNKLARDYRKIGALCGRVENLRQKEACFLGAGRAASESSGFDVAAATQLCEQIEPRGGEVLCLAGASFSFWDSEEYRSLAPTLCAELSSQEAVYCSTKADTVSQD